MLTPLDIQNKEFSKGIRGYKDIEVDSFLDEVIADYELIYKENKSLKNKIEMLNEQLSHFDSIEETLQKTLVIAQTTAEDVVVTARKKSDNIVEEANNRAQKIIGDANDQVMDIKRKYESVKQEMFAFKTKYKSFLSSQLETIDSYTREDYKFDGAEIKSEPGNYAVEDEDIVTNMKKEITMNFKDEIAKNLNKDMSIGLEDEQDLTITEQPELAQEIESLSAFQNQNSIEWNNA